MKTIFDLRTRNEVIARIDTLSDDSRPAWGRMTIFQMLRHCALWEGMMQGKQVFRRAFVGRLLGRAALKNVLKDERPLRRNTPTIAALTTPDTRGDVPAEKAKWIAAIGEYAHFSNDHFVHPFFGRMTQEQIGRFVYKHIDHHLRQFNA